MEYRDRDQGTAFLYNRLGWEVRDSSAKAPGNVTGAPAAEILPADAEVAPVAVPAIQVFKLPDA
jgi:hypothetical protein